jgi:DNA repair protein RecO
MPAQHAKTPALADFAYILRAHPYGESAVVLTALTAEHGKIRADFKGARGSRHHRGAGLEPLTRVRLSWHPGRELARIAELKVEHAPLTAITGFWQGAFLEYGAGLLDLLAQEGESQPPLFRLAGAASGPLLSAPPYAALIYLEFFALHLAGLLPDLSACPQCGRAPTVLSIGPGSARCERCSGGSQLIRLGGENLKFFQALRRTPPEKLAALAEGRSLPALEAPLAVLLRAALEKEIPGRNILLELLNTSSARNVV